jgi:hypothetical protein
MQLFLIFFALDRQKPNAHLYLSAISLTIMWCLRCPHNLLNAKNIERPLPSIFSTSNILPYPRHIDAAQQTTRNNEQHHSKPSIEMPWRVYTQLTPKASNGHYQLIYSIIPGICRLDNLCHLSSNVVNCKVERQEDVFIHNASPSNIPSAVSAPNDTRTGQQIERK